MGLKKLATLVVFQLAWLSAWAAPTLEQILARPERPNMAETLAVVDQIPSWDGIPITTEQATQLGYDQRIEIKKWLKILLKSGPSLIAAMEKTFPGATWGFLGRDAVAIADLVEAFYISIGQHDRVQRLGVSKASFKHTDHELYVDFLATHGMTPDSVKEYPYIFIDPISGGFGRQGRRLLAEFYAEFARLGGDPNLLIGRANMLGLTVSTFQGQPNDFSDMGNVVLKSLNSHLNNPSHDSEQFFNNHIIVTYPVQADAANESGYTHFIGAWHDSYGEMYRARNGEVLARIGSAFSEEMRKSILWTQKEIWKHIHKKDFLGKVQEEAKKLGYDFPLQRVKTGDRYSENWKKGTEILQRILQTPVAPNARSIAQLRQSQYALVVNQTSSTQQQNAFIQFIYQTMSLQAPYANEAGKNLVLLGVTQDLSNYWHPTFFTQVMMEELVIAMDRGAWTSEALSIMGELKNKIPALQGALVAIPGNQALPEYRALQESLGQCMRLL